MPILTRGMHYIAKTIMKKQRLPTTMYYNPRLMRIHGKALIIIKALPMIRQKKLDESMDAWKMP